MSSDAPQPVLSEERVEGFVTEIMAELGLGLIWQAKHSTEGRHVEKVLRAVERAVLEAVGGKPNCEVADIERRWGEITIANFRRDYPEIARELQRVTNIAVDLKDALNKVTALRARVAELELEVADYKDLLELPADTEEAVELFDEEVDGRHPIHYAAVQLKKARAERDTALRELEEAREDTARLDWLGAPDDVGGRWARVWRTWNGEEPLRAALDRARAGGFIK